MLNSLSKHIFLTKVSVFYFLCGEKIGFLVIHEQLLYCTLSTNFKMADGNDQSNSDNSAADCPITRKSCALMRPGSPPKGSVH